MATPADYADFTEKKTKKSFALLKVGVRSSALGGFFLSYL
jgi:hypothetical protein